MGLDPTFAIDFDLVGHRLLVDTVDGRSASFPLAGRSVAAFHADLVGAMAAVGVTGIDLADARRSTCRRRPALRRRHRARDLRPRPR
jgi:hypothetical protein